MKAFCAMLATVMSVIVIFLLHQVEWRQPYEPKYAAFFLAPTATFCIVYLGFCGLFKYLKEGK